MDISELKKLIKNSASVLVLDNGEPSFVILDYKAYRAITGEKEEKEVPINPVIQKSPHEREAEILDRLNKEILALKNQIEEEEKGLNNPHID
jgi:hypothetical protein